MNLKEFGIFFADLREKSGYKSQRELADKSGVSHSTINRLESGSHKVNPENLKILSKYLRGTTYQELMTAAGYLGQDQFNENNKLTDVEAQEILNDPDIQFIARSKKEMTPKQFQRMMELAKMAKEMADRDDDD